MGLSNFSTATPCTSKTEPAFITEETQVIWPDDDAQLPEIEDMPEWLSDEIEIERMIEEYNSCPFSSISVDEDVECEDVPPWLNDY